MNALFSLCALLLSSAATAPYIESFDVLVNNVDVIITDARGNRVTGLGQDDFVVLENGAPQPISNFSEYRAEQSLDAASAPAAAPQVSRKFVFLVDDMSLHPQIRRDLKRSIATLIESAMRDGDEAMIVTPESHERIALPFTSDRTVLRARLDEIVDSNRFRANTPLGLERHAMENDLAGHAATAQEAGIFATANRVANTLGHIQSVVSAMAEVPGKKTMILVTEWLPAIPGWRGFTDSRTDLPRSTLAGRYDVREKIDAIARTASTNGIAIYGLDLHQSSLGTAISGPDVQNRSGGAIDFQRLVSNTETTMSILAERTGASWSHDVPKLFANLQSDIATYYSIGYRPTSADANHPRHIDVRVKGRPELHVRARRDVIQKSTTEEMNERVVGHLVYPKDVDELGVTTTIGTPRRDKGAMLVPITVAVPIANLILLPDGNKYRGSFSVHYAAAGYGEFSAAVQREQILEIPAAKIEDARGHNFTYTSDLRVLPGKVDIAVGVLDPVSHLTTFKTISVDAN